MAPVLAAAYPGDRGVHVEQSQIRSCSTGTLQPARLDTDTERCLIDEEPIGELIGGLAACRQHREVTGCLPSRR